MGKNTNKPAPTKSAAPKKAHSVPSLVRKKKAEAKQARLLAKFAESAADAGAERKLKADKQQDAVRRDPLAVMAGLEYDAYLNRTKKKPIDPKKIARALMPNARF